MCVFLTNKLAREISGLLLFHLSKIAGQDVCCIDSSLNKKRALFPAPLRFSGKETLFGFFVILRCGFVEDHEDFLQRCLFVGLLHRGEFAREAA